MIAASVCRLKTLARLQAPVLGRTLSSKAPSLQVMSGNRINIIYRDSKQVQQEPNCEDQNEYSCSLDAECLRGYEPGGYHPVHLGDKFADGRYTITHKLGAGFHATVWAAKDRRNGAIVALKINKASTYSRSTEIAILRQLRQGSHHHSGRTHLPQILDHFLVSGSNGLHQCIVTDFAGRMLGDYWFQHPDRRLPGNLLKPIMRQLLTLADCLHANSIAHGNLHCGNVTLVQNVDDLVLGDPLTVPVTRKGGKAIEPGVPHYLVESLCNSFDEDTPDPQIKVIGFGEAFHNKTPRLRLHTPFCYRPPEAIFGDRLDHRVDLWAMGCMMFEMIVGEPIFEHRVWEASLLEEMLGYTGCALPERWAFAWKTMAQDIIKDPFQTAYPSIQDALQESYFDESYEEFYQCKRDQHFSLSDLMEAGSIIAKLLRLEPKERLTAKDALLEPWLIAE